MQLSAVLKRYLTVRESPDEIDIGEVQSAVEWLHKESLYVDAEHMVCIVQLDGSSLYTPHDNRGDEDGVDRRCIIPVHHNGDYKGSIHTHVHDGSWSYGFGFSPHDFYMIHKDGDHIAIVNSGVMNYALYRVLETRKKQLTWRERQESDDLLLELTSRARQGEMSFHEAERRFTREMCTRLKYVLYEGSRKGPLRKIWTP
jgi:hypothetical protein